MERDFGRRKTAVLARYPGNRWLLERLFLRLVAEGADRWQLSLQPAGSYKVEMWCCGQSDEMVPPPSKHVPGLPAALGSFESWPRRRWGALNRPLRQLTSGTWSGRFDFPIAYEYLATITYRAQWQRGRLSELDMRIGGAETLVGIAQAQIRLLADE